MEALEARTTPLTSQQSGVRTPVRTSSSGRIPLRSPAVNARGAKVVLSDKYTICEELGRGAFGQVFKGIDTRTGELVAIKQLSLTGASQEVLSGIMSEIELLKNLNHRHIVQYIGSFKTRMHLYVILEYMEDGALSGIIKPNRFGVFPESLVAVYITQVLRGLAYLHAQGVVHRDIKGANILTTKEGLVKLADFGVAAKLAEMEDGGAALRSSVVGTPYWMAPEVIEMTSVTSASDIWSVGCLAIELLTGQAPYFDLQPMSALFRIVQDPHPPLPQGVSPNMLDFLKQCFQKDPEKRPGAEILLMHPWVTINRQTLRASWSRTKDRKSRGGRTQAHASVASVVERMLEAEAEDNALEPPLPSPEPDLQSPLTPTTSAARQAWVPRATLSPSTSGREALRDSAMDQPSSRRSPPSRTTTLQSSIAEHPASRGSSTVPARQPSDSVTSQAGPFGTLTVLDPEGANGPGPPVSPMAHNVDPMKVMVDPPDTERLLAAKQDVCSKPAADSTCTTANPLAAPIMSDGCPLQGVSTSPVPNPLVAGQKDKSPPSSPAWQDAKATMRPARSNAHHLAEADSQELGSKQKLQGLAVDSGPGGPGHQGPRLNNRSNRRVFPRSHQRRNQRQQRSQPLICTCPKPGRTAWDIRALPEPQLLVGSPHSKVRIGRDTPKELYAKVLCSHKKCQASPATAYDHPTCSNRDLPGRSCLPVAAYSPALMDGLITHAASAPDVLSRSATMLCHWASPERRPPRRSSCQCSLAHLEELFEGALCTFWLLALLSAYAESKRHLFTLGLQQIATFSKGGTIPGTTGTPPPLCRIWEAMALKATKEHGATAFVLLGDDIHVQPVDWVQHVCSALEAQPHISCFLLNDCHEPGFPSFPVIRSKHLDIFEGKLVPSVFVNQDADPFLSELYRRLNGVHMLRDIFIQNQRGGVQVPGKAYIQPSYKHRQSKTGPEDRYLASDAAAKNAAQAQNYVIMFDDDVVPGSTTLQAYIAAFKANPGAAGFAGPSYLPHEKSVLAAAIHMSDVSFFWEMARSHDRLPWAVTANIAFKKASLEHVRFRSNFPKTGGGEDIDLCLRAAEELVAVPEAAVSHPLWSGGRLQAYKHPFCWAYGDGELIDLHPHLTYRCAPSAVEITFVLVGLSMASFIAWPTAALPRRLLATVPVLILAEASLEVARNCLMEERLKRHQDVFGYKRVIASVESSLIRDASELGRLLGHVQRWKIQNVCRRFDWFCGSLPAVVYGEQRKATIRLIMYVAAILVMLLL
ncbi:hypothetical protein WJX84_008559 [Apatococcus fuscideae]|uniref:non-specific serine/threonine protein kinase n=1 Tax=Apatococcus fuscideae TaxID=2026836 RepID=A0AAW1TE92_9CHLO